ncbi:MAG: heavy metal translocating P-type ATPase [Oscillatoriaceae cyanobacterium]
MQTSELITKTNSEATETITITLDVGGMKCAGCVMAVERQLQQHPGVISACVNFATEVAAVTCQEGTVDAETLAGKLTANGFPSQPRDVVDNPLAATAARHREEIRAGIVNLIIAAILIILSGIGHIVGEGWLINIWFHWGLATAALLLPGRPILLDGWQSLWRGTPNMNALVGLGATSAYLASSAALLFPQLGWECFFDEPVMMLGFILLGRTLEGLARRRAAASLQALMALKPATARLVGKPNGGDVAVSLASSWVEIPAASVRVGEYLQVLPGDKIPVDGEVVTGNSAVDESMLTGEAALVPKQPGDGVIGGTINQLGALLIRTTRTGKDTTLAQIVALVEEAQTRKAPVQRFADAVAGYFTYGVMAAAAVTFLFWCFLGTPFKGENTWPVFAAAEQGIHHHLAASSGNGSPVLLSLKLAISVLVIACPCALGLATPTAILVGTGVGARRGLLVKGGDALESVCQTDVVVFDKTGTLTTGCPRVTDGVVFGDVGNLDLLLQLAAAVECGANHPIASAIRRSVAERGLPLLTGEDFRSEPGLGVSAVVNGFGTVLVGTGEWLRSQGVTVAELSGDQWRGKTVVYVAVAGVYAGAVALEDELRLDAKATVKRLREMGLGVMLLTGDRQDVAQTIAEQLDMDADSVLAGVAPGGKAEAIARLQTQGLRVAMVGDGINDAPALAQADVGISLHGSTDVAMQTAGIILMRGALGDVVEAVALSRATFNKIRQNLFWAFGYNLAAIPIAAGVLLPAWGFALSPAAAGGLMAFSSVSVVTNSLLLYRFRR